MASTVLQAILDGGLTERHARALLKLTEEGEKLRAVGEILRRELTVAKTEEYIDSLLQPRQEVPPKADVKAFLQQVSRKLSGFQQLGIGVISERRETDSQIVLQITIPK
jgi:ParB family chromosome partitioning protein